ncbi:unnamed protein product [marine sediment metagenome]|uniref:Uncharacterized protein n=1 Tax=marine sediment metagenome TaxID=412755 RepID=X0ZK59_9ZZZZ
MITTTVIEMAAHGEAPEIEVRADSDKPVYIITKHPDFRMIYANGVFGSLTPLEGRIIFFADRLMPKIDQETKIMSTNHVEREQQIEIKMFGYMRPLNSKFSVFIHHQPRTSA